MGTIQEDILSEFFKQLAGLPEFDEDRVKALRDLFAAETKPKAATLVDVFSSDSKDKVP